MNAGRDVERLITSWLADEAAPGAPDRVLDSTRQVVHRTNQRRFAAIWREPMFSPMRTAAMAAALVVALIGGVFLGRVTAPSGVGTPVTTPAPTASAAAAAGPSIEDYRAARNAICATYGAQINPLKVPSDGFHDPALPAADRATRVQALTDLVTLSEAMTEELDGLQPPSSLAAEHAVDVSDYQEVNALIRTALRLVEQGEYGGAQAVDFATDPLSRKIEAFEARYSLAHCP